MVFDTVYYSHFWYSRFAGISLNDLHGDFFRNETTNHKSYLRLLSLIFPRIYIPRTHLITQLVDHQWEIPNHLFDSSEFRFFRETGTLVISTYPAFDAKQDSERITSRSSLTDEIRYATEKGYLDRVPVTNRFVVPSNSEAKTAANSFPAYGKWLEFASPQIGRLVQEIAKRSTLQDIPFFHESFIQQLRREFQDHPATFEKLWKETNSLYLTTGAPNQPNLIPYFHEALESIAYRFTQHPIDRYLFNPSSIYSFLSLFLDHKELKAFLAGPIEESCNYLIDDSNKDLLHGFRKTYFNVVDELSTHIYGTPLAAELNQTTIRSLQKQAIEKSLQGSAKFLEGALNDAKPIATAAGGSWPAGLTIAAAKSAIEYGRPYVETISMRWRYPELAKFIETMKLSLKNNR